MIKKYIIEHSFVKREKRIFRIDVGALPPEQVEAFMKEVKERMMGRNRLLFNNTDPIYGLIN